MATQVECTPADLTDEQRANLAKLAAYLRELPADYAAFEMALFSNDTEYAPHVIKCGTAACAVGHAPKAGIAPIGSEDWHEYSERALAAGDAWLWCFSGDWCDVDNSVHGAAARIEWLLERGLPENWSEQEDGSAPLCYSAQSAA